MKSNISVFNFNISVKDRQKLMNHNSFVLWFTGLSGAGKSTIANTLERELYQKGIHTYCLDGDNVRNGINNDLTFEPHDRKENIRRVAEVSKLLIDSGIVVLATFISPYKTSRETVKNIVGNDNFIEIYINTSLEECIKRDTKGLYKKARKGEIANLTGITAPFEAPETPNIEINTEKTPIEDAVKFIIDYINPKLQLKNE